MCVLSLSFLCCVWVFVLMLALSVISALLLFGFVEWLLVSGGFVL